MFVTGAEIKVQPSEIWDFFCKNKQRLLNDCEIVAESNDFDVVIYLTCVKDRPCLMIESSNVESAEFTMSPQGDDCEIVAEEIYDTYLTDKIISVMEDESGGFFSDDDISSETLREEELSCAVLHFIEDVVGDDPILYEDLLDDVVEDCKEHFLEYLYREHDISVYRPMELEDEDGVFQEDYPYECMEFDPNPIYED